MCGVSASVPFWDLDVMVYDYLSIHFRKSITHIGLCSVLHACFFCLLLSFISVFISFADFLGFVVGIVGVAVAVAVQCYCCYW